MKAESMMMVVDTVIITAALETTYLLFELG